MREISPQDLVHGALRSLQSLFLVVLLTAGLLILHANASTSAIIYLTAVVMFSTLAGQASSIYLAVLSSVCFDYFFLPPKHLLTISRGEDWVAFLAYIGSCIVVSRVADKARKQTKQAEQRREDVERLFTLSQEMMLHEDARNLVRDIPRLVERIFALDAVLLYVLDSDELFSSVPGDSSVAGPSSDGSLRISGAPGGTYQKLMHDALRHAVLEATEQRLPLPGGYTPVRMVFGMHSVGMLAWKPPALSLEVSTAIAGQVAIAITRAHAISISTSLEAARSADRLRTALIDSMTHELRTPLTAIRAASSTLLDGGGLDDETRTELAAIVDEESSRLDALIGEAMEMAQLQAGSIRVRVEPVHVITFLDQVVQELRTQLASHVIVMNVEQSELPASFDPHLIGRVLHHLLENAAQYTAAGTQISIEFKRANSELEFIVEDQGPGIDGHDLPHIFDKFYRGKHRSTPAKGSGMGLAIARAILSAHGGGIEARSTRKGASFRVWLPSGGKLISRESAGPAA